MGSCIEVMSPPPAVSQTIQLASESTEFILISTGRSSSISIVDECICFKMYECDRVISQMNCIRSIYLIFDFSFVNFLLIKSCWKSGVVNQPSNTISFSRIQVFVFPCLGEIQESNY